MKLVKFKKLNDFVVATFEGKIFKLQATKAFEDAFSRIGGEYLTTDGKWTFPPFVTEEILNEIIYNTCFECGGLMKHDVDEKYGKERYIRIRKCSSCGHSYA